MATILHILLAALSMLYTVPGVVAWGAAGHEIVATIAQIYLHPTVFPQLCDMLKFKSTNPNAPLCHLAPVAAWADNVRYAMRWSAPLHYIGALGDHPPDSCLFPGERGWAGRQSRNVLGAVRNTTDILREWTNDAKEGYPRSMQPTANMDTELDRENEALKFLIHFIGDLHMPLHLTGRDRGGNSVKVRFGGRLTNLHSLWDNLLIAKGIRTVPYNYSRPLPLPQIEFALRGTIYDPYVRRIIHQGILGKWRDEVHAWLSCPTTQPPYIRAPGGSYFRQRLISLRDASADIFSAGDETDDDVLCPYHWAKPIHQLNCDIVWPKALDEPPYSQHQSDSPEDNYHFSEFEAEFDELESQARIYLELDTPEYAGYIADEWIIEKLLAMAGVRLAGILNYLFADHDRFDSVQDILLS